MSEKNQQTQHTPGPWHAGQGNGEGCVFTDEGRMRLEAGGTTLYPICRVIDFEGERDANAKLIAASPELLQVILEVREDIAAENHVSDRTLEMIAQVIAKATIKPPTLTDGAEFSPNVCTPANT